MRNTENSGGKEVAGGSPCLVISDGGAGIAVRRVRSLTKGLRSQKSVTSYRLAPCWSFETCNLLRIHEQERDRGRAGSFEYVLIC
jgi:hypothetical protein